MLAKYPDIIVMSDDVYEHINFGAELRSLASFPELKDRVVILVDGCGNGHTHTLGEFHHFHIAYPCRGRDYHFIANYVHWHHSLNLKTEW